MRAYQYRFRFLLLIALTSAWLGGLSQAQAEQSFVNLRAASALIMPVTLDLDDVPLKTAVESLAKQAGVTVVWDKEELAKMDLPGEETVAVQTSQKIQFQRALSLVLEPLHLTYEDHGDSVFITSRQAFDQRVVKASYDLQAIVSDQLTSKALKEMITTQVAKGSWQQQDPDQPGYLEILGETLQVTHRREVQQEVGDCLENCRFQNPAE